MKQFLIIGEPDDVHVGYVRWALEAAGYQITLINSRHDSSLTRETLYLDETVDQFTVSTWSKAAAVWCRRLPLLPLFNPDRGEDEGFTLLQESRFAKWLIEMQENISPIRWVNPPTAASAAENKCTQLKSARSLGLKVPRTLITAEPERFRAFLHAEGTVVAKPLTGYTWEYNSGEALTTFANIIDADRGLALADDDIAQCVTIYQQRIEKAADVRVVVMGRKVFAHRVVQLGEQHFDFRVGFFREDELRYEVIEIPVALAEKIIGLMDSMKINFASADFALTSDGDFVFLDLNPSGQWLFLEHSSPEIRIGQKFCSFFVHGSVTSEGEALFPSYSDYRDSTVVKARQEAQEPVLTSSALPANLWKENSLSSHHAT